MKKQTFIQKANSYMKFQKISTVLLFLFISFSCLSQTEEPLALSKEPTQIPTVPVEDLPSPIKAKYLDPSSIAPPKVIPLKYEPTVIPAHPNVHPIGTPKINQIPEDLHILTLGKDGLMPEVIPAQPKVVPAYHPKPIPALNSRMRDAAIYDLQFLSEDEGLPFGGKSIIEDSKGHIWFGGKEGVIRYDGENFFPYTKKEGFFGGAALMEDSKGRIWFGYKGLGYYDGKTVTHFNEQEGINEIQFTAITEDSKGHIWLGTRVGVFKYDGQNFTFFNTKNRLTNFIEKKRGEVFGVGGPPIVTAIMEDSKGHIWWAKRGRGVVRYDGQQIIHYSEKEGLISNHIGSIMEDSKGQIWFGGGGEAMTELMAKGLSVYKKDSSTPQSLGGTFTNYSTQEGLSANRIEGIVEDDWGKIWLATYSNGLTCYDPDANNDQGSFTHYTTKEGLSHNSVIGLLKDSKKNIWLGLNNDGEVMRFKPNSFKHFTEQQGLAKNWVSGTLEDRKGNIWVGTSYGGLLKYDGQDFTNFSEKENLLKAFPRPLLADRQDNIWFKVRDRGVQYFDGKVFNFIGKEQGFIYPYLDDVRQDKQDQIWITSFTHLGKQMITRYHPESKQITHFATGDKGVGSGRILEDKDQQLWFGGMGCVLKYDPINDQLNYVLQLDVENRDWIHVLFEDDKDNLWFTMDNSQCIFKMKKGGDNSYISSYGKEQGFPEIRNYSYASIDNNKNVWLVKSGHGVVVFPKGLENLDSPKMSWIQYDKADGLKSLRYNSRNHIDSKNRLWATTIDEGITVLDLNTFEIPTDAPENLSLSHIDIKGQSIDFVRLADTTYRNTLAFSATLNESFDSAMAFKNYPTNLNLPFDLNHLTFHFSAIDWEAPHDIQYSFKMEGLDKDWSLLSTKAEVDYRNIPYGNYTFKVKAIGKANFWSEPFEYSFTIQPPWWHSWWAYGLYLLALAAVVLWYVRRMQKKIEAKQAQLEIEQSLNQELKNLNQELATTNEANQRFVPQGFLELLGKQSIKDLKLGDQTEKQMTVLFSDIRSYTTLSETMTPEENFNFINAYLGRVGPVIEKHGGFISQYFGDGLMALFVDDHQAAVQAAIEVQNELRQYNAERIAMEREPLTTGIGLNTGSLMLGIIGDSKRYDSTVISDAVNTASRMEGLTKIFGGSVILSEKTLETLPEDHGLCYRYLGMVKVKGKDAALKIYDFYESDGDAQKVLKDKTKLKFEDGITYYFNQQFGKAADSFKIVLSQNANDRAAEYYLAKAVKYIVNGVKEGWSGVEEMIVK